MSTDRPKIGLLGDTRHQQLADTYRQLLKHTAYSDCPTRRLIFDPANPERTTRSFERYEVVLTGIGVPGTQAYQGEVSRFLDSYAAAMKKPPVGIISHAPEATREAAMRWLEGDGRALHDLPEGHLNIVDASRPLFPQTLERALDILTKGSNRLSADPSHAIPYTTVSVGTLVQGIDTRTRQNS